MDEILNQLSETIIEVLTDKSNKIESPFVLKYIHNGSLYGYHASTFCQVTTDILKAKRYYGDVKKQIKTVKTNLTSILNVPLRSSDSLQNSITSKLYEGYWKGIKLEDVFIDFEYLPTDTEPQVPRVSNFK